MMSFFAKLFGKKEGADKRRFERVEIPLNVAYSLEVGGALRTGLLNRTKNVSLGGVCVLLYESFARETGIFINLSVSDACSVTVKGSIAWQVAYKEEDGRTRYETGVKFADLDNEDKKILQTLIKRYARTDR